MWEHETNLDMAEIYRQHYEDALDEIRNLRWRIKELESEKSTFSNTFSNRDTETGSFTFQNEER